MDRLQDLGRQIERLRRAAGLGRERMAEELKAIRASGIDSSRSDITSASSLRRVEKGERAPTITELWNISLMLDERLPEDRPTFDYLAQRWREHGSLSPVSQPPSRGGEDRAQNASRRQEKLAWMKEIRESMEGDGKASGKSLLLLLLDMNVEDED